MYQWIAARRMKMDQANGQHDGRGPQPAVGFARIEVAAGAPSESASLTIETRTGRKVVVGGGEIDGDRLRRVVEALEAC